jgi:hypothetical protein
MGHIDPSHMQRILELEKLMVAAKLVVAGS